MKTKLSGKITAVFGEHLAGIAKETRKPYNFINLSNGMEKRAFGTSLPKEQTDHLNPGDEITVEISVDAWNPRDNQVLSIE